MMKKLYQNFYLLNDGIMSEVSPEVQGGVPKIVKDFIDNTLTYGDLRDDYKSVLDSEHMKNYDYTVLEKAIKKIGAQDLDNILKAITSKEDAEDLMTHIILEKIDSEVQVIIEQGECRKEKSLKEEEESQKREEVKQAEEDIVYI